ncbi:N-acetyltransferase [Devosia pacifica]|uniref:N-acetyltransferase n=1 Tax=Devosia pacifica TaxID=1335967 RepID=A0A918S3X5_9HYPH|nr:GNAT family N-acetyltransferase [Devosia pacifica]GHA23310.1 N-acetyltransferase [Devosia pacifica]
MTYSIRRLTSADFDAYKAIRLEALENHPEAFVTSAEDFLANGDMAVVSALKQLVIFGAVLDDGSLAGIMAFAGNSGSKDRHKGYLVQVYVRPPMRGTGCARQLLDHVLDYAAGRVQQLHLGVWTENAPALTLYKRAGFEIYGTEPRYLFVNGRYVDEHLMVRFLDRDGSDSKAPEKEDIQ